VAEFDYAEAAADALEMLAEFGQAGQIRRTTRTGGGPSDPTGGTETVTDYAATLVVLPINRDNAGRDVAGTVIKTDDLRVLVGPLAIEPTTTDRIVCSEGVLTIIDPGKLSPSGEAVLYDMTARK
jgi:hypothetical protein